MGIINLWTLLENLGVASNVLLRIQSSELYL